MVIIHPQVLISASFISLALLLVSATPIPSHGVVSGAAIDAVVTRNSDQFSQLQTPSATQVLPRADYTSPEPSARDYSPIAFIQPTMNEIYDMYEFDRHPSAGPLKDKINHVARLISELSTREVSDTKTGPSVFHYIARIKYFVATWADSKERGVAGARWANPEERKVAIANIEACEAAAIGKFPDLEKKPAEALKLMENVIKAESNESFQYHELKKFTEYLSHLSLVEQGTRLKELEVGYGIIQRKINGWKQDELKALAEVELRSWQQLNSLVDPSHKVKIDE